jgi:hypothetical protein
VIGAADLTGHWRRDWLIAPSSAGAGREDGRSDGSRSEAPLRDDTTAVHWLQAPGGYVDLRIPAGLERLRGAAPMDLPAADLAALLGAEGFAGTIAVGGGVCTWTRAIDWHGPSDTVDAGRMAWEDGALMETGVAADYAERWLREPSEGMGARVLSSGAWRLHLAWSDAALAMGVEDPGGPSSAPLREALGRGERPGAAVARRFRGEFTLARWDRDRAVAVLSTHPMRAGDPLLRRADLDGAALELVRRDASGGRLAERWAA